MASTPAVSAARYAPSRRDRAISFVLAVLVGVLLVYVLVIMSGVAGGGGAEGGQLVAVNISPPAAEKDKQKAAPRQDEKQQPQVQTVTTPPPKLPPRVVIPSKNQVDWPPGFIHMSKADLAKADISQIKPSGGSSGASGAASGGSGSAEGNAGGPGGARVYNAEWYREPYDAELSPYMGAARGAPPGSWATIICHTVERYHVEDCREVDESPRGSGLARALRQAAWQFLVRPPRVDGKVMVGAWVSIRFTWRAPKGADGAAGQD